MTQEVLKLALEAMESVTVECNNFHHPKKDQNHHWAKCPPVARWDKAITAIKEALAQPEQEPVAHWSDCAVHSEPAYPKGECDCGGFNPTAWLVEDADGSYLYWTYKEPIGNEKWTPLFSTPPQEQQSCDKRTWVGLAAEDRLTAKYMQDAPDGIEAVIDYIEAKLKEKNT